MSQNLLKMKNMENNNKEENNNQNSNLPKLKSKQLVYKGKFLSYSINNFEVHKKGQNPINIPYETIDYNSRIFDEKDIQNNFIGKNIYNIYATTIIPIIKYSSKPKKIIIISVFRYPQNKFCLEFPGGFMDKGDQPSGGGGSHFMEQVKIAALRELEEETGYKGNFICCTSKFFGNNNIEDQLKLGGNIFYDPWKSADNSLQCLVEINGDDINCRKKEQNLDADEFIKVYEVELDNLMEFINKKMSEEGFGCSGELYNVAFGINFNKIFNNNSIINSK